ncbi:hypothetical protein [Streptomyces sp. NPDC001492]
MSLSSLHPAVLTTRRVTVKHWRDGWTINRRAFLGDWQVTRLDDGSLHLSARVRGRDAAKALHHFVDRQSQFLAQRIGPDSGHLLPTLDVSQPGRTAACWRFSGVWVEVWHPDMLSAPSEPVQAEPAWSSAGPGGRLPFTRKQRTTNPKETTA